MDNLLPLTPLQTWILIGVGAVCLFAIGTLIASCLGIGKMVEIDDERFADKIINGR